MNLKLLETFLAVIDQKTMSQAAKQLFTSQPNVSMMIMDLEEHFGKRLFYRTTKGLELTPEGMKLELYARRIVRDLNEMNEKMFSGKRTLRIGGSVTVGQYLMNGFLQRIREEMPHLQFEVMISNTADVEDAVLNEQLDLAVVEGKVLSNKIKQTEVMDDSLFAVISGDFSLEKQIRKLDDLQKIPWVAREEGSRNRNQFELELKKRNITPTVVFRATNLDTILQAVENQYGFAILSELSLAEIQKKQNLNVLGFADYHCTRSIRVIRKSEKETDSFTESILHCIQRELKNCTNHTRS